MTLQLQLSDANITCCPLKRHNYLAVYLQGRVLCSHDLASLDPALLASKANRTALKQNHDTSRVHSLLSIMSSLGDEAANLSAACVSLAQRNPNNSDARPVASSEQSPRLIGGPNHGLTSIRVSNVCPQRGDRSSMVCSMMMGKSCTR